MAIVKKRLIIWLLRAYIKRWGKIIILYFFLGLVIFFLLLVGFTYLAPKLPFGRNEVIGVYGNYRTDSLPETIIRDLGQGLTTVDEHGQVHPGMASSWAIENSGKTYIFRLKQNITYTDGSSVTSSSINLHYKDVTTTFPDKNTIVFTLQNPYTPFLITVSKPIFKKDFIGVGSYTLSNIKLNGNFVESMSLRSQSAPYQTISYEFYPTQDALKVAFALGEVSQIASIDDIAFKNTTFSTFPHTKIDKQVNYSELVTLFYNTSDKILSDKKVRSALAYTLPNTFVFGLRAQSPLSPLSWAYQPNNEYLQDFDHAKLLLQAAGYDDKTKIPTLEIDTLPRFKATAEVIASVWKKIGVTCKIVITDHAPSSVSYQLFLGNFQVPKDPDQYTLWHSDQQNNITNYKNLRIDKLLEDGRRTQEQEKRVTLYANFQKYLIEDQPATFLYFPYTYSITRK